MAASNFPLTTAASETGAVSRNSRMPLRDSSLIMRIVRSGGMKITSSQNGQPPPRNTASAPLTSPPPWPSARRKKFAWKNCTRQNRIHASGARNRAPSSRR